MKLEYIILICISVVAVFTFWSFFAVARILFNIHLKRTKPEKWNRECSVDEPVQLSMYDSAIEYRSGLSNIKALEIVNDGFRLYGEYTDFGYDKAVIIIPGRTEAMYYGYYFAKAYAESGYNILTIDQRAHGKSEGRYNSIGYKEHKDILAWGKLLHESFGVNEIWLHGICIGSSCAMFALVNPDCPEYFCGMTAEGMYPNFYESFKNHMIALKKPVFPCLQLVERLVRKEIGITMKYGPIDIIERLDKPLLMLHSREDLYSLPETAEQLFEKCSSRKNIVWFEKGAHSQLRYADSERYDNAVSNFVKECSREHALV